MMKEYRFEMVLREGDVCHVEAYGVVRGEKLSKSTVAYDSISGEKADRFSDSFPAARNEFNGLVNAMIQLQRDPIEMKFSLDRIEGDVE